MLSSSHVRRQGIRLRLQLCRVLPSRLGRLSIPYRSGPHKLLFVSQSPRPPRLQELAVLGADGTPLGRCPKREECPLSPLLGLVQEKEDEEEDAAATANANLPTERGC